MKKIFMCAALSVVLLSGCSFLHRYDGLVKVDGKVITKAEFDRVFDKEINNSPFKNFGGAKNFLKTDENPMYVIFKEKVMNELIIKALLDEEIAKRGIKVSNEDIKNETKLIVDKVGSMDELSKMLKQRGVSNSDFTEDLKNQIKMKKLINSIEKVSVSEAEAQKYYNAHLDQFKHGEQVRASHILIAVDTLQIIRDARAKDKDITPEQLNKKVEDVYASQKAKAEAILAEVKANPDKFEEIAAKNSDDKVSGERGGELGFFAKEAMVPEFSKVAFSMKPNTISQNLVKTPYGYHIIKVTDRMAAGTEPFAKMKDEIRFYLETEKQIKILKNLTSGLMKSAKIEYLDESFKPKNDIVKKAVEAQKK